MGIKLTDYITPETEFDLTKKHGATIFRLLVLNDMVRDEYYLG